MTYNLSSLSLPTLRGRTLRLFAAAVDSGPLNGPLVSQLLKQGGVTGLRDKTYGDAPTFYPLALGEADTRSTAPLDWDALQSHLLARANREPFASVADYARAYRDGATTPEAVAEAALATRETIRATMPARMRPPMV